MTIREEINRLITGAAITRKLNYTEEFEEMSFYITNVLNTDIEGEMTENINKYLEHKSEEYCHFYEYNRGE